jgi:hypothetical protein
MSDVSDDQLDDETRTARQNYRKLAQQWVDDEDARVLKLAGQIHEAINDYLDKIGKAAEEAEGSLKSSLKAMEAKLIEGEGIWKMRLERLKGESEADPNL